MNHGTGAEVLDTDLKFRKRKRFCGNPQDIITMQNRLFYQDTKLNRTIHNISHPYPPIIESMRSCLDLNDFVAESSTSDFNVDAYDMCSLSAILELSS